MRFSSFFLLFFFFFSFSIRPFFSVRFNTSVHKCFEILSKQVPSGIKQIASFPLRIISFHSEESVLGGRFCLLSAERLTIYARIQGRIWQGFELCQASIVKVKSHENQIMHTDLREGNKSIVPTLLSFDKTTCMLLLLLLSQSLNVLFTNIRSSVLHPNYLISEPSTTMI